MLFDGFRHQGYGAGQVAHTCAHRARQEESDAMMDLNDEVSASGAGT